MGATRTLFSVLLTSCLLNLAVSQNEVVEDLNNVARANAYFSEKLYKQFSKNSTNLIFSPVSIFAALSMLSVGADGTSLQELNSTLGYSFAQLNEQELLQGYLSTVTSLTESHDSHEFSLANALYVQETFPAYPNYTRILIESFHAESRSVDFLKEEETLSIINEWVSQATRGKITSILEHLSPLDVMALVNAVYFKGIWLDQFDERFTSDIDFFNVNGTRKQVKMMSRELTAKYERNHVAGGAVLELPYKDHFFSMIFILPEIGQTLEYVEERLSPDVLYQITDTLHAQNLTVGIPKLTIRSEIDLIKHLEEIGIREIFTEDSNLYRASPVFMKVTQAKHKATIEITEEGAEGSAVTAIVTTTRIGSINPYFWLNRPFMFILRHNPTNTICFMGKVADV